MMFRAFLFRTDAGDYWSVVDNHTYETIQVADAFLQYMRFGRGRTESTSRKYAEAVALYFSYWRTRHHQLVVGRAALMGVAPGQGHTESASGPAHVADGPAATEVEPLREGLDVAQR